MGCPLEGRCAVIVDDVFQVIDIRETVSIIKCEGGSLAAIIVAVDLMERITMPNDDELTQGPSAIGQIGVG
jgi:orotate phosphoribosyltransferase